VVIAKTELLKVIQKAKTKNSNNKPHFNKATKQMILKGTHLKTNQRLDLVLNLSIYYFLTSRIKNVQV